MKLILSFQYSVNIYPLIMISLEFQKLLRFCTSFIYFTGAYAVRWVDNEKTIQWIKINKNKFYYILTAIHFINIFLYEVFLSHRIVQFLSKPETDTTPLLNVIQLFWNLSSYSIPVMFQMQSFKMWNEVYIFINCYLTCFEKLKCEFWLNYI